MEAQSNEARETKKRNKQTSNRILWKSLKEFSTSPRKLL
jgi:hypothetical protein